MSKVNLGPVSAYADAVKHGYTGTREQFGKDQADFAKNAAQVAADLEASKKVLGSVEEAGNTQKTAIQTAGSAQVEAVQYAGALEVADVENAGAAERASLDEAAEAKTAEVEERIEAKGTAVLATIPADYTETYQRALRNESRISRNEKRLTNLEQGITPDPYYVDDTVAYSKDVPANALPFAEVGMVGGMTRKCRNLLNVPDCSITGSVSFVNVENGVIRRGALKYMETSYVVAEDVVNSIPNKTLEPGVYTFSVEFVELKGLSAAPSGCYVDVTMEDGTSEKIFAGTPKELKGSGTIKGFRSDMYAMDAGDAVAFRIQIERGSVATEYDHYFEGIRSASVTEVESVGANLFGGDEFARVLTENGGVLDEAAGTVTLSSANAKGDTYFTGFKPDTQYTFFFGIVNGSSATSGNITIIIRYTDETYEYLKPSVDGESTIVKTSDANKSVKALEGAQQRNTVFKYANCGVFEGTLTTDDFKPYHEPIVFSIPEAVQALDGYGQGDPDNQEEYNAIVWRENGKPAYSHKGNMVNGAWVPLAKEEVTDISDLLPDDNYIPVEGGGTVTMVNEYEYAVPSEIAYALKEAE